MKTAVDLQTVTRERFPAISVKADALLLRRYDDLDPIYAFSWFESLADALNREMSAGAPFSLHAPLFRFLADAFPQGSDEVRGCIDVGFTENLFWEVEADKVEPYWRLLPEALKELYVAFHHKTPL